MSRYCDDGDYDENFPNEAEFWRANAYRALKGRRGRKVLSDLRDALRNLPQKRLIEGALCTMGSERRVAQAVAQNGAAETWHARSLQENIDEINHGEGVCAIGAYLWWQKVKTGSNPVEAFDLLPTLLDDDHSLEDTASLAKREANLVYSLAWDLAYRNDEVFNGTPEERYERFLAWLDQELAEVPA